MRGTCSKDVPARVNYCATFGFGREALAGKARQVPHRGTIIEEG